MSNNKLIIASLTLIIASTTSFFAYKYYFSNNHKPPFTTQKPIKQDLNKIVDAEGSLEAIEYSKIGPLISGTVQKILVKEDQYITKDTLLTTLDNGTGGDTDVRQQEALLAQAKSSFVYLDKNYKRQRELFKTGQLAKDTFEKLTQDWQNATSAIKAQQALLDRAKYIFSNTQIRAPISGTILAINVKDGEAVSITSPATVLFEIAHDLEKMNIVLEIEESKIGDIKAGQQATVTVDTYPTKQWLCSITKTGHAARVKAKQGQGSMMTCYKAEGTIENKELHLLPGMTAHAKIAVAEQKNALTLPCHVFQMAKEPIKALALKLKYEYKPLSDAEKNAFKEKYPQTPIQSVWKVNGKSITEVIVKTGITTAALFEILEGINENDEILIDIEETDEMKEIYKKMVS